jgi:hypothetical protein
MSKRMKAAFGCHMLALLLIAVSGVVYLSRTEFMPYHAVALGKTWEEIDRASQILTLGSLRIIGGAWLAAALAMGVMLFVPFRQGEQWARWAIPFIGFVAEVPALHTTLSVTFNTPATPPWIGILFIMVLLIVGFILSMEKKREEGAVG